MRIRSLLSAAAGAASLAFAAGAQAQSIDYGSLQSLFGEPVTTSATGSPQRASETPVAMSIITAEDIKRSGAVDIPTILSRVAGVQVEQWGAGASDVGVRGYNQPLSPRLLVLINGRQVYTDSYGYTAWNALPVQLDEIRQIEVVKGPNSALFGFNAVSGVINIVTYNPKYDQVDNAKAQVGTQGYSGFDVVQTLKLGSRVSARISLGDSRSDEFKTNNPSITPGELHPPHQVDAGIDLLAQITPQLQARVEANWANNQETMVLVQNDYSRTRSLNNSERITLIDESPIGLLQVSAYKNANTTVLEQYPNPIDWDNYVTVVQAQDLVKLDPRDTIKIAFEYRHNSLNTSPQDVGRVTYDVYSPSVMWNAVINARLSVTVALRYDDLNLGFVGAFPALYPITSGAYNRSVSALSANAGVVYKVTDKDALRLSYARGVQAPSLAEYGGVLEGLPEPLPHGILAVIGNPGIQPAIVANYELDWDHDLTALKAKFGVRVFYQTTDHVQALPSTAALAYYPTLTTAAAVAFMNVGNSDMVGAEFEASGVFGKGFRWNANYTFSDVHNDPLPGVDLGAQSADYAATTPKHTANLGLGWSQGKWAIDGYAQYVSAHAGYSFTTDSPVGIGDYATLAGRVGYSVTKRLTFAVSGQNLQASRTTETPGLPVERRVFATLTANW